MAVFLNEGEVHGGAAPIDEAQVLPSVDSVSALAQRVRGTPDALEYKSKLSFEGLPDQAW